MRECQEGGSVRLIGYLTGDGEALAGLLGLCQVGEWVGYVVGEQHGRQCLVHGNEVVLSWSSG